MYIFLIFKVERAREHGANARPWNIYVLNKRRGRGLKIGFFNFCFNFDKQVGIVKGSYT